MVKVHGSILKYIEIVVVTKAVIFWGVCVCSFTQIS